MTDSIDCIVAGAGVVGLAIGRRLALEGIDVAVLEAEERIGFHTSSRNSEVIHAGIYYPKGSLKARLCVEGKLSLYDYCAEKRVPHKRIGKLIVATNKDEERVLSEIDRKARENGVCDLEFLTAGDVSSYEPGVSATAALFSPSTGIVDSHEFMVNLGADIENGGGSVVLRSRVCSVRRLSTGFEVHLAGESAPVHCRSFVNAAGLWASELAESFVGTPLIKPQRTWLARGHYFSYTGASPFHHLVYPVPFDGGLGIHATNDMAGAARFGPDVQWLDSIDYSFGENLREKFLESIRRYFPDVSPERLHPSYTGIRPKLNGPGTAPADFMILGPDSHGVPGLVHLFGMESPGLTASLAVADYVYGLMSD